MSYASILFLLAALGTEGTTVAPSPPKSDTKSDLEICIGREKSRFEHMKCIRQEIDKRWEYAEELYLRILKSESPDRQKLLMASRERWVAYWSEENELINHMLPFEDGYYATSESMRLKLIDDRILSLEIYAQRCTLEETQTKSGIGTCLPPL